MRLPSTLDTTVHFVLIDPYANAFNDGPKGSEWAKDHTDMKPELHERKWEIDSLCYPVRLWPLGITMRALTSSNDAEILSCLRMLKATHAGTGFMHEASDQDDPTRFTRKWFAWANTLFGELALKVRAEKPHRLGERPG